MLELNFSPFPEINTKRMLLRKLTDGDAPALLFLRSDDRVMKYIGREKMKTEEQATALVQKINTSVDANESIMWAIALQEKPATLIGTICYWNILKDHYRAEVGYILHPDFWGMGMMKEALAATVNFGFRVMKLHSIEGQINPENTVSGIVLEKCGFLREAYFKENYYFKGKFFNSAVYSLLAK